MVLRALLGTHPTMKLLTGTQIWTSRSAPFVTASWITRTRQGLHPCQCTIPSKCARPSRSRVCEPQGCGRAADHVPHNDVPLLTWCAECYTVAWYDGKLVNNNIKQIINLPQEPTTWKSVNIPTLPYRQAPKQTLMSYPDISSPIIISPVTKVVVKQV